MIRLFLSSVLLVFVFAGFSQKQYSPAFIDYLVAKENYREALFLIDHKIKPRVSLYTDSIRYLEGWSHYSLKQLDASTNAFLTVSPASDFYAKSHFFAGYNQLFMGQYQRASSIFSQVKSTNSSLEALRNFELSGVQLLQGNAEQARNLLMKSDSSLAALSTQWSNMNQIITELENHKAKKPWLAGLMSAVVPGSGKFYAGKKGEGVASFIGTVSFGLVAWENYRKLGIKHPKTIIFGSIFAATYVSNIYGSVVSVRIYETEYNHAIHNQILFQLHIPLRNYFD